MSSPQIGVHLADHSFFPIFESDAPGRRRVVLSTSRTDQECVDIVLYRRDPTFVEEEERLGHILLCDIARGTPDESEIELLLDLHDDGSIEATATDRRSGNSRTVAIDEDDVMPEYHDGDQFTAGSVEALLDDDELLDEEVEPPRRRRGIWLWLLLLLILAAALAWWFLLRSDGANRGSGDAAAAGAAPAQEAPSGEETSTAEESPPAETAAPEEAGSGDAAPIVEESQPLPEASSGAGAPDVGAADTGDSAGAGMTAEDYHIKWGDTLWDISTVFYGTPWRFREIADENAISNPDRIFADDNIKIPRE